ncbi:UNVERIFIED_CONTAM: hypothetical protein K2H54_015124, partial [Gekko kuhli]
MTFLHFSSFRLGAEFHSLPVLSLLDASLCPPPLPCLFYGVLSSNLLSLSSRLPTVPFALHGLLPPLLFIIAMPCLGSNTEVSDQNTDLHVQASGVTNLQVGPGDLLELQLLSGLQRS